MCIRRAFLCVLHETVASPSVRVRYIGLHCEAEKKEPIFCVHLFFKTCEKLLNFFHIYYGKYKVQFRVFNFGLC